MSTAFCSVFCQADPTLLQGCCALGSLDADL